MCHIPVGERLEGVAYRGCFPYHGGMKGNRTLWLGLAASAALLAGCATLPGEDTYSQSEFETFYRSFRMKVQAEGLSGEALDAAFGGSIRPVGAVLSSEKTQPETTRTFREYLASMLSETRRTKGVALMAEHQAALKRAETASGVPASVITALWGIESNFGANQGTHPVIPGLVTLAWKSPRGEFFGREAINALRVAEKERMNPADIKGSWAGAMGQCQFMPSTFLKHAKDGDGDGREDIWNNPADVFASAGNYLKALGWQAGKPWRLRAAATVRLDDDKTKFNERGLSEPQTISQWQRWGVVGSGASFSAFGGPETRTRLYKPLGTSGPLFMVGPNYDVILGWNRSSYFATSVLLLAESLDKGGALPDVE